MIGFSLSKLSTMPRLPSFITLHYVAHWEQPHQTLRSTGSCEPSQSLVSIKYKYHRTALAHFKNHNWFPVFIVHYTVSFVTNVTLSSLSTSNTQHYLSHLCIQIPDHYSPKSNKYRVHTATLTRCESGSHIFATLQLGAVSCAGAVK